MGLIELEKNKLNQTPVQNPTYSDSVYKNDSLSNLNNVGTETYTFATSDENRIANNLATSSNPRFQKEGSLLAFCLTTIIPSFFLIFLIIGLGYLALTSFTPIEIFPYRSSYTADEFNSSLRRSFIILFIIISFLSIISMIIINNIVKSRFNNYYLSKFKMYFYDFFIIIQNILLYICEMFIMFSVVNSIYNDFTSWKSSGIITGNVNIDTIEIFKYVIVIVMTIFIVINSFSSIDIIHQKNKIVFENQI